jgi:hypothetical protein
MKPISSRAKQDRLRFSRFSQPFYFLFLYFLFFACFIPEALGQDDVTTAVNRAKAAGIQEDALNRMLVLGYKYKLRSEQLAELILLAKEAKEQDFPVDHAVGKMEEGLAKKAQVKAIHRAVEQEMARFSTVRMIIGQSMGKRGMREDEIQENHLTRSANTLAMGLSEQEIKGFFEDAPRASMNDLVASLEFMTALQQGMVSHETAKEISFAGLEMDFFSKGAWGLAQVIGVAKGKKVSEETVKSEALSVMKGEKNLSDAQRALGLQSQDMVRGPIVVTPHSGGSEMQGGVSQGHAPGQGGGHGGASGGAGSSGGGQGGSGAGSGGGGQGGSGGGGTGGSGGGGR